jgi:hypothetical protein
MPRLPITGSELYDCVGIIILVIVGVGLATKADKPWGWAFVAAAAWWGFKLVPLLLHM